MPIDTPPEIPVRVVVDVSRRCNLSCYYCHSTSGPKYKGPSISGARVASILDGADRFGIFEVTITGGEPLLWDGLAVLAEASQSLRYTSLQLITNATLVNDRALELLSAAEIRRICVSLDGPRDVHDAVRGPGRFDRTLAGIARLRQVVDNIAVISVLDRNNYKLWPELTALLIDVGVKQHHLTPVCFAGSAMDQFDDRALRDEEFAEVVDILGRVEGNLPPGFILAFKDGLLRPLSERSFTLSGFTCEYFKGHHIVIQPTGKVQRAARAWGRTWRADECIGNINDQDLYDILRSERPTAVPLEFQEEMQRKYHILSVQHGTIDQDLADVANVAAGGRGDLSGPDQVDWSRVKPGSLIGVVPLPRLGRLARSYHTSPGRYRLRRCGDAFLFFDTETFEIHILSQEEARLVEGAEVPA